MKYRHSFHAGNFADVHKHVALLALIARCRRRTRASSTWTRTPAAAATSSTAPTPTRAPRRGSALARSRPRHPGFARSAPTSWPWRAVALECGTRQPIPARRCSRRPPCASQDRGRCCRNRRPSECRALERALARLAAHAAASAATATRHLKSQLPPPERRALVLHRPAVRRTRTQERARRGGDRRRRWQRLANAGDHRSGTRSRTSARSARGCAPGRAPRRTGAARRTVAAPARLARRSQRLRSADRQPALPVGSRDATMAASTGNSAGRRPPGRHAHQMARP